MTEPSAPAFRSLIAGSGRASARTTVPATPVAPTIPLEERPRFQRARDLLLAPVLVSVTYLVAGKLGLQLGIVHPSASAVWAPSGIALAAMLVVGHRVWPGVFVAAYLVNATTAGSFLSSFGIAAGNTLEAVVGAALVNRFANGLHAFDRPGDTFRFAMLAGLLGTALSPTIGVLSLALAGFAHWSEFGQIWLTWWLGDMGGVLVVSPLLVLWLGQPRPRWSRVQLVEACAMLLGLLLVSRVVFRFAFPTNTLDHPLEFLCMPLLVWAAFRFDQRIVAAAIFEISAIAVWGTLSAAAPHAPRELNESLVVLQVFMGVAAVTTLELAAVVAQRRRNDAAILATTDELHEAMTELEAFSRSITHDLRSPVGAVLNSSAVLAQDYGARLEEPGMRVVRRIRTSAEAAAHLLDQLTDYAWVGREASEDRTLDMTGLAREVYAEIVVGGEDVSDLRFELWPLPPGRGSPELVRCVFRNLLTNAIKYTRGRKDRRVQVAGAVGHRENTYSVIDNGIGFDPAHAEALFQPFRRLSGAQRFEGSGLGLAIVARIIRRQHGHVWAESDGSTGARFLFTLPGGGRRS